jgi:23S rRNA G2445 N2-methylase RlmL
MKIVKEKFKTDHKNKLYWGRVYFISDNREWKTKIMWVMSFEWVRLQLFSEKWQDAQVDKLVNKVVVPKWKNAGRVIFNRKVQFDVRVADEKEKTSLLGFIQKKDEIERRS